MISLQHVTIRYGQHILLNNINWTIYSDQRIGLIGANGSGKTTLFSLLLQKHQADTGDINIPRQLKFAYVAQETLPYTNSALQFVLDGDEELRSIEKELLDAEEKNNALRIANLHEKLSQIDAYTAPSRAAKLLNGLGFNEEEQKKSVNMFSGGWRVRLNLAKALMCRSDVLLLDEPTNHLDLDAVLWLEEWLSSYTGTLLLISHDRDFLDKTINHIVHLAHQQLTCYTGNYSTFETLRASSLLLQQATYEKQQKQIAHMKAFVDRFRYKATKARQAQSRLKAIERIELVAAVQADTPFHFVFKEPKYCPNPLISLNHASIAYAENAILSNINFSIAPNERIALIGPNGAGKSSLIKLLAGEIQVTNGKREISSGLKIGYFAQHQVEQLKLDETPLDHMKNLDSALSDTELRKFLGGFGFSGEKTLEPVKHFSGGEKSRLALALLVWQRPNLLLLDEPTNHLDLEMRNALSLALQEYEGAMILVSHDRFLVRSTTDQLMLVAEGKLQNFDGDLEDYQQWLFRFRKNQNSPDPVKSAKKNNIKQSSSKEILKLENKLSKLQSQLSDLENVLLDQNIYAPENKNELEQCLLNIDQLKKEIEMTEQKWLETHESP